ncbi:MAG: TIGR03943 family putative permease subunit [Aggregatilineales bacterium]
MLLQQLQQSRVRQWLQAFVLVGLGLYFLDNMLTGRVALYVNDAQFGWVPWLGTALFLAIGAVQVIDLIRPYLAKTDPHDHDHDHTHDHAEDCDDCDHDHAHQDHEGHDHSQAPSWLKLVIIGIPLAIGIFVPAKPLSSAAVQTGGISTGLSSVGSGTSASFDVAPTDRTVLDWVREFGTASDVNQFAGQAADVTGFVYRDIRFDGKPQFMVARFVIACCVADASAIGVTVQADHADQWQQDAWVHVTGKFAIQSVNGTPTPVLIADAVRPVTQPDHPYLYP